MDIALSIIVTLLILFIVPIVIYSFFVKFAGLEEPDKKLIFMISVLVQKIGTAAGFVALFVIGKEAFLDNWLTYGLIWAGMFTVVELGQSIAPGYSKKEAIAGAISEFIYFPLSALATALLLS